MTLLDSAIISDATDARSIRVVVISTERIFSDAVVARFRHEADFNALGVAYSGKDVSDTLKSLSPEVLVVDASTDGSTISQIVRTARDRNPRVVIVALISASEMKSVSQLISLGVTSCVLKSSSISELVTAVRFAAKGSGWMSPALLPHLFVELQQTESNEKDERLSKLTSREREILALMVDGRCRADIADELCLAFTTIRTHTRNLMDKLGVHSSTAAVSVALAAGIRPSI